MIIWKKNGGSISSLVHDSLKECALALKPNWTFILKLYCGYLYTRPCMINCIWGLKQLWLQVNGHAWFHLHEIHWTVRNRLGLKNSKWKYMPPVGSNPPTPRHDQWYSALDRSATLVRYQLSIYSLSVSWYITYRHVTMHVWNRLCLIANAKFCKQ